MATEKNTSQKTTGQRSSGGTSKSVSARAASSGKNSNSQKNASSRNTSTGKKTSAREKIDAAPPSSALIHQFIPFFLIVAILFLTACFLLSGVDGAMGSVGTALCDLLCGLFGFSAFFIPIILLNLAIYWRKYVDMNMVRWKVALSFVTLAVVSALFHVVYIFKDYSWEMYGKSIFGSNWTDGIALNGGGFIGGFFGGLFRCLTGSVGSLIILISAIALSVMFLFSVTPRYVWTSIRYRMMLWNEKREERKAQFATEFEADDETDEEKIKTDTRTKTSIKKEDEIRAARDKRRAASNGRHGPVTLTDDEPDFPVDPDDEPDDGLDIDAPFITGTIERETKHSKSKENTGIPVLIPSTDASNIDITPASPSAPSFADPADEHTAQGTKNPEKLLDEIFGPAKDAPQNDFSAASSVTPSSSAGSSDIEPQSENMELPLTQITDSPITEEESPETSDPSDTTDPSVVIADSDADQKKKRIEQLAAYIFPSPELLHEVENPSNEDIAAELRSNAQKLMNKLAAFNVHIKKIEYSRGPTITRYELYPEASTRVRSISNLSDDIALELAATVRIEAPIPNKNAVGVEVPNASRAIVFIRELIESEKFRNMPSKLSACLGKDVGGNMIFADIAKMPHLLIAGTTGSGKSVCLNCIILSLLYKARPDEVQFIMIDPKKIEMGMYNKLPHLKVPVVTDMKKAAGTLNAAVNEMEHRYELFEEVNARDLDGYNRAMSMGDPDFVPLPKIVIIIDELADLMMTAPSEIEGSIIRIAQKARAAGIHLIVGTQRPSVNVITGLIKANIPSRIAFSVASGTDSRIIIDITGAEKLIGKGDMLFSPVGALKPARVQGAFVADDEVEAVTNFIKANNTAMEYDSDFISDIERETERLAASDKKSGGSDDDDGGDYVQAADELFTKALRIAVDNGTIATSFLQRKLSIGFGRAGKIIDRMEALGFVSAANGTKPRNVLLTKQQLMELEMAQDPRVNGNLN
ncbi:MAG: DNA translocase FtsK [Clostridia bacterium]|nr:DNA translocase FtsK [Clostridia bacterium]